MIFVVVSGVGSRRPVGFVFSKVGRFSGLPVLRPVLRRRKIVKERGQKRDRAGLVNEAAPIKEPDDGHMLDHLRNSQLSQEEEISKQDPWECISLEPKNCQPAQEEIRKQEPQHGLQRRIGLSALLPFRRDPEGKFCYICGDDNHDKFFCPFNYLYGQHGLRVCNSRFPPGKHPMVSSSHREFLRCFVRVNNMPPKFRQWHLGRVCKSFGRLRLWHVPMVNDQVCRGLGFVIFKSREHAESAIAWVAANCESTGHILVSNFCKLLFSPCW